MTKAGKFVVSALVAATVLGGGLALPSVANAAAAAKPAGCLVKTTRSAEGAMIGPWKCEGTTWRKVSVPARQPYWGLFGLGEKPTLKMS